MFGIKHIKFDSTTYVVHYKNGNIKREGRGLSFYYYSPNSSIVAIPYGSDDVQFIFNETTVDFQNVSVQGQLTYKIENPKQLADLLDFTVDSSGTYKKDDYEKLSQRLISESQTAASNFIKSLDVRKAITSAKKIEQIIFDGIKASKAVQMLGIIPLSVNVLAIKPDPSMAKALEAKTREALQVEADQAVYERRNFAVEQERRIKESEYNTEITIEEKKKQVLEKKMESDVLKEENNRKLREMRIEADAAVDKKEFENKKFKEESEKKLRMIRINADIEVEEDRKKYITIKTEIERQEAETKAYALEQTLKQYKELDWKVITAINAGENTTPAQNISLAFRELAENAQKINNLNISPDLLDSIIQQSPNTLNNNNYSEEQEYR